MGAGGEELLSRRGYWVCLQRHEPCKGEDGGKERRQEKRLEEDIGRDRRGRVEERERLWGRSEG